MTSIRIRTLMQTALRYLLLCVVMIVFSFKLFAKKPKMLPTIYFGQFSSELNPASDSMLYAKLEELYEMANDAPFEFYIFGLCDSVEFKEEGDRIANKRAEVVYKYLVEIGVPDCQLHIMSWDENSFKRERYWDHASMRRVAFSMISNEISEEVFGESYAGGMYEDCFDEDLPEIFFEETFKKITEYKKKTKHPLVVAIYLTDSWQGLEGYFECGTDDPSNSNTEILGRKIREAREKQIRVNIEKYNTVVNCELMTRTGFMNSVYVYVFQSACGK